jgi:hypothetical protein
MIRPPAAAGLVSMLLAVLLMSAAGSTPAWSDPAERWIGTDDTRADGGATPTATPTYTPRPSGGYKLGEAIGIRLLEAPVSRRDDPRAQTSIVDHVKPGTTIQRRIEVSNNSTKRVDRRIEVYAGAATIKDHKFVVSSGRKPNELASWITVDHPILDMPPNTTAVVRVTIAVPTTASKGERYAAIWAWTSARPGQIRNVGLASAVAIPVFLDVGPGGEPASDFQISGIKPGRTEEGRPRIQARVRNTGGRALVMSGTLTLTARDGNLQAGPYPARLGTTLRPGDTAPILVLLDNLVTDGPWKVKLTLRSGRVEHTATATLTFPGRPGAWGLPAKLQSPLPLAFTATSALVALALIVLLTVAYRRARSRPRMGRA